MKRRVAQWIGGVLLSAISILIYLILFQTFIFSRPALSLLNNYLLNAQGIQITGTIHGSLFRDELSLQQAEILVQGDTLLTSENIRMRNWEWSWETAEWIVSDISFEDYKIQSQYAKNIVRRDSKSANDFLLIINHITGSNGEITYELQNSLTSIKVFDFAADLWLLDGYTQLKVPSASVFLPGQVADTLHLEALIEINDQGIIDINRLAINADDKSLNLTGKLDQGHYTASLNVRNINAKYFEKMQIPDQIADTYMDLHLELDLNADRLHLSGKGDLVLNDERLPFHLHHYHKDLGGETVDLQLGTNSSSIAFKASRDSNGITDGSAELFQFNLATYLPFGPLQVSEPTGTISFRGDPNSFHLFPRLSSFTINTVEFDSLIADIEMQTQGDLYISKGSMTQDNNRMNISGTVSTERIDLSGSIDYSDFPFKQKDTQDNRVTGSIGSDFNITGTLKEPHIRGTLSSDKLSYNSMLTLTGSGKIDLLYSQGSMKGEFALQGSEGFLLGDSLKSYKILANMSEAGYFIEDLHLQGSKNMISMSGAFGPEGIDLYKLNFISDVNKLRLANSVHIQRNQDQEFSIPSTVLNFNKGGLALSGTYSLANGLNLESQFELISLKQVLQFIRVDQTFSGLATGTAQLTGALFDPVIQVKMNLKEGVTLGYPSDSARIDLTMTSSKIISNEIEAFTKNGSLVLNGELPWGYTIKVIDVGNTAQNFSLAVDNYRLRDLNFSSVAGFPISGRATGTISIRGTPENTKLDGQLSLADASFDILNFSSAYSDFNYEGNMLTFDSLSMVSTWGYGNGAGFIPITLDLIAQDRMRAAHRDMGLDFDFILNEMPFLSSYISTIDAIHGDFIGSFGLSGPMLAPLRNGHIRGSNARLEISELGNPITDIHSEISLIDNTLFIDHFSGRMLFSEGSNLQSQGVVGYLTSNFNELIGVKGNQSYAGVVTAAGSIDLQSFFEPDFNVTLQANEVYFRSANGLIEAIANAEMRVIGQDTTDVTAVIPVKRAAYYSNFEAEESYEQVVSLDDSSLFRYSLDTQFASDLLISNDQMEAEFEGELWLLDYGDGVMRFTGKLTVVQGGKFYYVGNELSLISGEIIFNSVDFNPQINMEAEILIDGERVRLILSGDLNEPELVINAENTKLTQSDVLTYLTINQKSLEEGFDRNSALDPVKTYSEMLVEKQLSKIGRDIIGLDILEVGINLGRGDTTTVSRFQVGQRLSKNLKITAASDLQPTDGKTDYDFGLEYQINQNVSVTSKVNQNGEVELNGRFKFTY